MADLGDNEVEILKDDLVHWLSLPVTNEFRKRLLSLFDHQSALMGSQQGASVDLLMGRAQVLDVVLNPLRLFED